MLTIPAIALLLQAAVPAVPVAHSESITLAAAISTEPTLSRPADAVAVPLRLGATDESGCVWGASSQSYCRHPSSAYGEVLDADPGRVLRFSVSELAYAPYTVWAPECRWRTVYEACFAVVAFDPEGYRVWVHQQEVATDFEEHSVGLRRGREIMLAREAGGSEASSVSPGARQAGTGSGGGAAPTGGGGKKRF